jgi:hypothetical protein
MPFLMASAPVRRGRVRSLRSKAAVWLLPSTGSEGEALKRLGLSAGLSMLRIVRICVVGSDGQRKRGGRAKSRRLGWRGGIAMCGVDVNVFDPAAAVVFTRSRLVLLKFVGRTKSGDRIPGPLGLRILAGVHLSDLEDAALVIGAHTKAFARS